MSGFVATGGSTPPKIATLSNAGFWPDIELDKARDVMRFTDTVTDIRLTEALVNAMASVNGETDMKAWRQGKQAVGFTTLADVPADQIDGESVLVQHYRRAVYCFAKANLVERYRDYDTTREGQKKTDTLDEQPDALRRDGRFAVRDLLGRSRITVELI
ncbi:head completion/stabilization protein [Jeongeupia chitinilytica]|uniref:Phage head completion/stabilization protein n=1 Tax=Jeongeupia chitinilytica TaxID=1041641 RepID=A0ABQ3GZ90_9NEIS|nr:head completion/stabilization protein [Jeongeupia chitinilytica]GHD59885.1 phage head completion/stabilization protein [Jeongeupia chitinilytica]